ncbi:31090_t:CDS:10 [Gigaspora margarita]|uniref:31090_t:CDS:1 n=1 Tax=Gigaspora margarita TaxID=4874 RepID=A0ABM8W468_GIGMA|nr:31090_t:CDS:10 [Gigaspora margarita]
MANHQKNQKITISKYKIYSNQFESIYDVENVTLKSDLIVYHENSLEIFGFTNKNRSYSIVYELDNYDYLSNYLRRHSLITWKDKITLLCLVFDGLKYLYNNNVDRFILDPKNIIMHNLIPKITNIEMSKDNTEVETGIETFHENYDISLTIRINKVARKSFINRKSLKYIDLCKLFSHDGYDKRLIWHKIAEELENISCDQKYIKNPKQVNDHTRLDKKFLILPDFHSLEGVESKKQIGMFFQLNKGRNRDGYNFISAKKEIFENIEIKSEKLEFIPTVYFAKINAEPWGFLNNLNLSTRFDNDDSNIIKILFPIRTLEHSGNLKVDLVRELKDALKISDINEKRDKLKRILYENGKFVITKFIIGGAITIDCSKVDVKSIERLQAYLYWAIKYAKGEAQPVFELTSLDNFPSFETFPSRPMKIAKDLYFWLKDVYDSKDVTIISYESYKPSYELLDDKLRQEIFDCFDYKPTNQILPKLIPQLPAEYKQKNFSEWISKSSLLLRVNELIEKLSLQCGIFLRNKKLGYGKKSSFKFLKEPETTLMKNTTISFINSKNQQITYPLPTINKFKSTETSYHITPLNYNYSKKICFQIKYHVAKISLDSSNISFENCYSQILPKTIYIGGTLTKIYDDCDIPDIPNLPSKFSKEILPEQIEQFLIELGKNNNIDTTSFISNDGKVINQNQINDWLKQILYNPEHWEIISFEDWKPTYQMFSQLRDDVKFISENEYQMVFNGENSLNYDDQNSIAIKYPHPLIDDNCQIYGYIAKKYSDNLDESWERIPAAITFDQANRYGCNVIIHRNNNLKLNKVAAKIKWFVIAKSDGSYEDNYANSKVTCGELDIDGSQNEIYIKTNNNQTNYILATSLVHKSPSDRTCYYNITLKYWTKYRIVLKIHKEKQENLTDFSNNKEEIIEEKITLKWCIIGTNEKDIKNQNNAYQWNQCGVILDSDSRKDDDDEQNYQRPFEYLGKIISLGNFLYLDKNSKENEWIIQLDITVEAIKSERNLKKLNLLDFLYNIIKQNQKQLFLDAMRFHGLDGYLIDQEKLTTYTTSIKSLTLSPIYYYWALSKFKANSFIASLLVDDDILGPLFKGYLPKLYKIPDSFQFPLPIIEIESELKKIKHNIDTRSDEIQVTEEFKTYLREFVTDADIELN